MAKTSAKKKWNRYAEQFGYDLSAVFNDSIRATIKVGIRALVYNTVQDSGRAAYHWVVIPNKGGQPGRWSQLKFNPAYNHGPVGKPGDAGKNQQAVIKAVIDRETSRAVDAVVKGRKGQATKFVFQSNIPAEQVDREWGRPEVRENYRKAAKLKEAKEAALSQMQSKFQKEIAKGNTRKRPLR